MKQLHSIEEVIDALYAYVPDMASLKKNYTLDRMRDFMDEIGNPQDTYYTIHIAGTSGKTSTTYFTRTLLHNAGRSTGLTVSPHIVSITERVQVNGQPLSDEDFLAYLNRFLSLVEASTIRLSYFEILMAFAYWIFAECHVDYAVIETGLGGLLDASNVITRADKVCVITDIGLDHTEILGETIEEIAFQKAGIIQPDNHLVLIKQKRQAMDVIQREAVNRHASVKVIEPITNTQLPHSPLFQRRNMAMAVAVYHYVAERDSLAPLSENAIVAASTQTPPGRMEYYDVAGREVILDGAHNPQKLHMLRSTLAESDIRTAAVLASFIQAPEQKIEDSLAELKQFSSYLILTEFSVTRNSAKKSVPAKELAERASRLGFVSVDLHPELPNAVAALLRCPEDTLVVTGSLYLVSQVRALLPEQK